jgi:hypothetical protein
VLGNIFKEMSDYALLGAQTETTNFADLKGGLFLVVPVHKFVNS